MPQAFQISQLALGNLWAIFVNAGELHRHDVACVLVVDLAITTPTKEPSLVVLLFHWIQNDLAVAVVVLALR